MSAEVVVWLLKLVDAELVGENFVVIYGLTIVHWVPLPSFLISALLGCDKTGEEVEPLAESQKG